MRKQKGFSLIELLIVVAIILIIAAIAIPNLLRSRVAANEASAVGSTRTIATSEITFNTTYPATGYADIGALGGTAAQCAAPDATHACLIDNSLATAIDAAHAKSGYIFSTPVVSTTDFMAQGIPATAGTSGVRGFCTSTDAVVRQQTTGAALATSALCMALPAL